MSVLKASDITEAMEVFRQRCRALDVKLETFVNTMLKPLCNRVDELKTENSELKAIIKELVTAVDEQSNLCSDCRKKNGQNPCDDCPWYQARDRAEEWTKEEAE